MLTSIYCIHENVSINQSINLNLCYMKITSDCAAAHQISPKQIYLNDIFACRLLSHFSDFTLSHRLLEWLLYVPGILHVCATFRLFMSQLVPAFTLCTKYTFLNHYSIRVYLIIRYFSFSVCWVIPVVPVIMTPSSFWSYLIHPDEPITWSLAQVTVRTDLYEHVHGST